MFSSVFTGFCGSRRASDKFIKFTLISFFLLTLVSCSIEDDDKEYVPSYITDFVEASTNSDCLIDKIVIDDGTTYIFPQPYIKAEVADTTYRCIATFAKDENSYYTFYALNHVYSANPQPASSFKTLTHDPMKVQSVWKKHGYINMTLGLMTAGAGKHEYGFCIDSIANDTAYVSLLHKRDDKDPEAYTAMMYLSMPCKVDAEHIKLTINTYDGKQAFKF